jgi:AraC-like DNA-binding protein
LAVDTMHHIDLNTDALAPSTRRHVWEDRLSQAFGRIEVLSRPTEAPLQARYHSTQRGSLRFNSMEYAGAGLRRSSRSVAEDACELFTLTIPTAGRLLVSHEHEERVLEPGHVYLFNHSIPYSTLPQDVYATHSIGFCADDLRRRVAHLGPFYRLSFADAGAGGAQLLQSFVNHLAEGALNWSEHEFTTLSEQMFDLMALLIVQRASPASAETSARLAHRQRAIQYIRTHIEEEDLCPRSVAQACGISVSYLHQLFRDSERSVEAMITEERLQMACRKLKDPRCGHMSVASIAYESGFNDATHFSRAFKRRFGCTPGDRRRGLSP